MAAVCNQEEVLRNLKDALGDEQTPHSKINSRDNRGPDHIHIDADGKRYYFEAIAFSKPGGKNQSDFWKAFAQAISRLNPGSIWGKPDYVAIALPSEYLDGWLQRVKNHGDYVWSRIGTAFPELQIWFVSKDGIQPYSWNDAYDWEHSPQLSIK